MLKIIRKMSVWNQGLLWLMGINVHNHITDECTPDFSCCSHIRTPFKERLAYIRHWIKIRKQV